MNSPRTMVVASNNMHKIQEISAILGQNWRVLPAQDVSPGISWEETGSTFLENARIKAKALKALTKECVLADDSGLCVEALGGKPGVFSSSFGGREGDHAANNARLMRELEGVDHSKRGAFFICVLVFLDENGIETIAEGRCDGFIAEEFSGEHGFGYDPLFFVTSHGKTMAQLSEGTKNSVSHRGRALRDLLNRLKG